MRGAGKWTSIWKRLVVKDSHWNRKSRGGGRVFKDGKDLHMLTGRRDGMAGSTAEERQLSKVPEEQMDSRAPVGR